MAGSCDDCGRMLTWEERYDFEGHGGETISECGLPDDLWTDELNELSRQGRCPFWKPIEVDDDHKQAVRTHKNPKNRQKRLLEDMKEVVK